MANRRLQATKVAYTSLADGRTPLPILLLQLPRRPCESEGCQLIYD